MRGKEILDKAIGKKLLDGRVQSFVLKGNLVDQINVTFLNFGNEWLRIVCTDEITDIKIANDDISNINFFGDDEFKYPIEPISRYFPEFSRYIGKKLLNYKELVRKEAKSLSFGLNFYFENSKNWVIYNEEYPDEKNEYIFENKIPEGLLEK